MTITPNALKKIAALSYLTIDASDCAALTQDINSIMNFMNQLQSIDTSNVSPLCHPFSSHQRLRADEVTEGHCTEELKAIAPLFEDNLYLVPQVLESSK